MAQTTRIEPDLEFIKELQAVGGDSMKKCYQCATCSVACPISPGANPYPRKEMVWAQWGLKDKLINNIDIWLCHNCGTCSDLCPRGAKPGDLLGALRNMAYQKLTTPSVIGKWMSSSKYLPMLVSIPAIIYLVIWVIRASMLGTAFPLTADGEIQYGLLFPGDTTIDPIFSLAFFFAMWAFFNGIKNLIKSFQPEGTTVVLGEGAGKSWIKCLIEVVTDEIMPHSKFQDCGDDKADRKVGHMALFYGFVALFIVTSVVAVGHWGGLLIGHQLHTPLHFDNPVKWLANLGAVLLVVGLAVLTRRRLSLEDKKSSSNYYDWYLLGLIWVIGLSGIGAELLRLAGIAVLAYPVYFVHLVSVFMMIAYLPWSKLGHLVYRTAALTYARYMGRKVM